MRGCALPRISRARRSPSSTLCTGTMCMARTSSSGASESSSTVARCRTRIRIWLCHWSGSVCLGLAGPEARERLVQVRFAGDLAVEGLPAAAVRAGGHHQDHAARPHGRLRRRHALDRLVEVLVQGIAPVRRQDQIRHRRAHAAVPGRGRRSPPRARAPRRPPPAAIARLSWSITALTMKASPARRAAQTMSRWIGLPSSTPGARPRIVDEGRAVVRKHGPAPRDAREHALAPAREPREEVRLDEPLRHQQIRLRREAVDHQRPARGQRPQVDEVRLVVAVVNHDLLPRVQLRPDFSRSSSGAVARWQPVATSSVISARPGSRAGSPRASAAGSPGSARAACGRSGARRPSSCRARARTGAARRWGCPARCRTSASSLSPHAGSCAVSTAARSSSGRSAVSSARP